MKFDRKYSTVLTAFLMSLSMSASMSFAILLINTGLDAGFPARWLRGAAIGFTVGLPISLAVLPMIRKTVEGLTK